MNDLAEIVAFYASRPNETFALATLMRVTGSSYRRPGARMLIAQNGDYAGSLSAGCLEDEVAAVAREVIESGTPRVIPFDTRRRFGCAGSIEVFVERVSNDLLGKLASSVAARRPLRLETEVANGTRSLAERDLPMSAGLLQEIEPRIRLLIVGSGADAIALREHGALLGWELVCVESIADWNGEPDVWTAAIVVTHNYGRDCAALRHLLPAGLRYLGVIGPRRRRDEMLSDALDAGATMSSRLFSPAGLHLGAETAREIALSVLAEIQMVFADASGVPLSERRARIHSSTSADVVA